MARTRLATLLTRVAKWFALAWAVGSGVFLAFGPVYSSQTSTLEGAVVHGSSSLLSVAGPRVLIILGLPVVAAVVALLPVAKGYGQQVAAFAGFVVLALAFIGAASVGMFFVPTALALLVAAVATDGDEAAKPDYGSGR